VLLKSSLHRSVWLEQAPSGALRVIKRFERRGPLASAHDRRRAQRELELLSALHARGLSVPRPLGLERRDAGWEVAMEWIADARPLDQVLAEPSGGAEGARLARALGQLLAALHLAGLDHPDLHLGNVLVDGRGRPFAVDFHKARLARTLSPARRLADLAALAASARERVSRRFRARAFLSWARSLEAESGQPAFPKAERAELAREIEQRALRLRRDRVRRRQVRWTREGTACRAIDGESRGFERADLPEGFAAALAQRAGGAALAGALSTCALPGQRAGPALLLGRALGPGVLRGWYAAARLTEHGVHTARPLCLVRSPGPWAALELPPGAATIASSAPVAADELRACGELCGALLDRGLRLDPLRLEELWIDADGRAAAAGALRRAPAGRGARRGIAQAWLALLLPASQRSPAEARAAFAAGIPLGLRLEARAAARMREELSGG
jgi:tRNA A-37 threonylcarbamoyl transferase component Bud32